MIRVALPAGDLRAAAAALLEDAGIAVPDYGAGSRALRFPVIDEGVGIARVFREKDIPVQVALGNYDVAICGSVWIEELTRRFPGHEVVRVADLSFGSQQLWLASAGDGRESSQRSVVPAVRVVSEYANIAEAVARRLRLRRYSILPVWGAAEAYPPEDADIALIAAKDAAGVQAHGLEPLARVFESSAWLIANNSSLGSKDLSPVLSTILRRGRTNATGTSLVVPRQLPLAPAGGMQKRTAVRMALPDGHAQTHTRAALDAAGIRVFGYGEGTVVRRPRVDMEAVEAKMIRPQDMPQHVALGHFDIAITGRDWLFDHLVQFPSSPVEELVDLGRSRYSLAAIAKDVEAESVQGALDEWRSRGRTPIRIASEYGNIADHFARAWHVGRYSIIPIAGASEAFVPDDADILIEGIDTGASVRANELQVLERLFESTNCVIANKRRPEGWLRPVFDQLLDRLRESAMASRATARGA